jgi:hypothetical protein
MMLQSIKAGDFQGSLADIERHLLQTGKPALPVICVIPRWIKDRGLQRTVSMIAASVSLNDM